MNDLKNKTILILAPHTDDGEFGCGGTIHNLIKSNNNVYYCAFSACKQSVLKQFPSDILITEVKAATKLLGIKQSNLILFDYEVRTFNYRRQEILEDMIKLRMDINPEIIFMPSLHDIHQDHFTIAQESLRAFKFCSILSYEVPWNNLTFNTTCFMMLDEEAITAKVNALSEYKSQAHRSYANEEFIRSLAITRGTQIGTRYAETFEVQRWVLK
jgi:LmbE family N-acetylglucosaminyl deacetylase